MTQNRLGEQGTDTARQQSQGAIVDQHFKDLLEASSLGTPAARRIRSSTSADVVDDVRRRSMEHSRKMALLRRASARTAMFDHATGTEGRYFAGSGALMCRQVTDLQAQQADVAVKVKESQAALERAEGTDMERTENHRGGDRTWLLRLLIPAAVLAEGVTAYVAMEALVASQPLAIGLAILVALIGVGMACILANRRLNRLPVPAAARIPEGIFVTVLTVLRYAGLHIQGADVLTAVGAAVLAALMSALGLLGIEEIVVETRTFGIFFSTVRVSWKRWRYAAATTRLAKIQARINAAAGKLQQHFLVFLLKTEGLPLDQARSRAAALLQSMEYGQVPPASRTTRRQIIIPLPVSVLFAPNEAVLLPGAGRILRELARGLTSTYPAATAEIAGYTAAVSGGDGLALSQARAQAVASYLEDRGVSASRLSARGYGDHDQIASDATAARQALNRRLVVTLQVPGARRRRVWLRPQEPGLFPHPDTGRRRSRRMAALAAAAAVAFVSAAIAVVATGFLLGHSAPVHTPRPPAGPPSASVPGDLTGHHASPTAPRPAPPTEQPSASTVPTGLP